MLYAASVNLTSSFSPFAAAAHPDFSPSPVSPAPLPLSLPFSLEPPPPLPSEDPDGGDIPFPLLLYEEVLLAGLLQLHQVAGAVESVDQLLAMQPQCAMPSEIARHFAGSQFCLVLL